MSETKVITFDELALHNKQNDCWICIYGKVYDVTNFLDEHPGGFDILLAATAKDSTEEFEDIGHSSSAIAMLEQFYVGELQGGADEARKRAAENEPKVLQQENPIIKFIQIILPIAIILGAFILRKFPQQREQLYQFAMNQMPITWVKEKMGSSSTLEAAAASKATQTNQQPKINIAQVPVREDDDVAPKVTEQAAQVES